MIEEKFEALEKFKFEAIEKELGKVIKIVRFVHGRKYYGKYGSTKHHMGSFALYFQDIGIVPQYTMFGTPEQKAVAKRHNRTLKDMMRNIMSRCNLS